MQNPQSKQLQLILLLISSMIVWGISWPINKILTRHAAPVDLAVIRYLMVVPFMIFLLFILKIPFRVSKKGFVPLILVSALMALYSFLFMQGLALGKPGEGGVIVTTLNPIMAYAFGMILAKKTPLKKDIFGLLVGLLAGLILLRIYTNTAFLSNESTQFLLLCALVWAIASKISSKSSNYGHPLAFTFWMYVFTLLFISVFSSPQAIFNTLQFPLGEFWFNMFFSSVITTGLATTLYFVAVSKLGAEQASGFIFIVPLAAALASWIILNEKIETHTIIGGILGVLAVYILNKKTKKPIL